MSNPLCRIFYRAQKRHNLRMWSVLLGDNVVRRLLSHLEKMQLYCFAVCLRGTQLFV